MALLLDEIGVGSDAVHLAVRSYRPGRRAVVEAAGRRGRLLLKVVRPAMVADLHATHRLLAPRVPVPDSLGWSDDGIMVLPGLPGRTMRRARRVGFMGRSPRVGAGRGDGCPPSLDERELEHVTADGELVGAWSGRGSV
ncbi:MAG: hypothetical protein ACRDZ2_05960, partial [Ilumatobacteraceae bacterium]